MRLGRFRITQDLLRATDVDGLARIFSDCAVVPVRIEYDFACDAYEYTALSPHFVDLPEGSLAPLYRIIVFVETRAGVTLVRQACIE